MFGKHGLRRLTPMQRVIVGLALMAFFGGSAIFLLKPAKPRLTFNEVIVEYRE